MKRVLVSLLMGLTLCGGLVGCGNDISTKEVENKVVEDHVVEDKVVEEYSYDPYQENLQPYRDATAYIQQEANKSGYDFKVYLNEATKTIEISFDTGDTSVSDLREVGYDDEYIISLGDFESLYSSCQVLAISCYTEAVANYGVVDIQIEVTMRIGGETICVFNQSGDCIYSIF